MSKCIELAQYTETALTEMSQRYPELADEEAKLAARRKSTEAARDKTRELRKQRKHRRVAVRIADVLADEGLRALKRAAVDAEGMEGGRLVSLLFPDGITPMVRLQGVSQIGEMADLEHTLEQVKDWEGAASEKAKLTALREKYQAAVEAQAELEDSIRKSIIEREAAKADLVTVLDQVARKIQIRFPRNRRMQDVFFDRFRARRVEVEDGDGDLSDQSNEG